MVEFFDPVQNLVLSYYLDKRVRQRLDKVKKAVMKKDEDKVMIVDGMERSGKSVFTFQMAKYIDPTFSLDRVCFTPSEFLNAIKNGNKGQVIVFDEAFRGLSSKASISKINRTIVQAMMEMGQKNLIIFIVLPTFFLLEPYAATLRSVALFHIYKTRNGQRAFKVYNYKKKSQLYFVGKRKGFDYTFPFTNFKGRFWNKYAIPEIPYREKKSKALMDIYSDDKKENEEEQPFYTHYQKELKKSLNTIRNLKGKGYTNTEIGKIMGCDEGSIRHVLKKDAESHKNI